MADLHVKQCRLCRKYKRFGAWIEPPIELQYAINSGEIDVIETICPDCIDPLPQTA